MSGKHAICAGRKCRTALRGMIILLVLCCACAERQQAWQGYNIPPAPDKTGNARAEKQPETAAEQGGKKFDTDREGGRGADNSRPEASAIRHAGGLPVDYRDFKARYAQQGVTPEGAVKLYFDAVFCYMNPATRSEGEKMLRYALREKKDWDRSVVYQTFVGRMKDSGYGYIFRSYAAGTSVQNGYAMSPENYRLDIAKIWARHPSGDLQVMLRSSGADTPRPIYLRQHDGLWFVVNNAATYADVRRPETELDRTGHDADYDDVNYRSGSSL